ncbi:MAG: hypothetical protein ACYC2K_01485 [Gemmatimonadales bacterium]
MEILFLLILFAVGNLLKSNAEKKRREQAEHQPDLEEAAPERDDLMEEIRRAMEGMRQQRLPDAEQPRYGQGRAQLPAPRADDDSFEEEDTSLEEFPTVRSLEDEVVRPERVLVDYDVQSEAAVQRRIEWAEVRARAHRPEDHRAFDRRIRVVEPEAIAPVAARESIDRKKLMQLVVWREILDKPLALRERDRA